jgi:hypothetical protein
VPGREGGSVGILTEETKRLPEGGWLFGILNYELNENDDLNFRSGAAEEQRLGFAAFPYP